MSTHHDVAGWLVWVRDSDPSWHLHDPALADYRRRNAQVFRAVAAALEAGYEAGIGIESEISAEPGFRTVAYIDLPTGQVSWHLPEYVGEYDGHSTAAKYRRIEDFVATLYPRGLPAQRVLLQEYPQGRQP